MTTERASLKTILWDVKTRLQFTGWLQYIPTALAACVCLLLAAAGWLVGALPVLTFWPPMIVGSLLLLFFVFDVVTSKLGLRPSEPLPQRREQLDAFDLRVRNHIFS